MNPLRNSMIKEMQIRQFSDATQCAYLKGVRQLSEYYNCSPDKLTEKEAQAFILHLAQVKKQSWNTCNVAVSGIRFFYKVIMKKKSDDFYIPLARRQQKLPDILTPQEVKRVLDSIDCYKHRVALMTLYSAGLRVSEVVELTVNDIDSEAMVLCVRQGKMKKDRYTPLSKKLLIELRLCWKKYRPETYLFPGRTAKKTIAARTLRYAFESAKQAAGINKQVTLHGLRHAFATHLLESGTGLIDIKQCLGHASLSTTLRYARMSKKLIGEIKSPFDQ